MTDSVEILTTTNSGFSTTTSSVKVIAATKTAQNGKIDAQYVYIAILRCRSLSQSPENSFFELGVVEKPRFAVKIVTISAILSKISVLPVLAAILLFLVVRQCCIYL